MALSDEQLAILAQIAQVAPLYKEQDIALKDRRQEMYALVRQAISLKLTTYQVAEVAQLSQPRISQIVRTPT